MERKLSLYQVIAGKAGPEHQVAGKALVVLYPPQAEELFNQSDQNAVKALLNKGITMREAELAATAYSIGTD